MQSPFKFLDSFTKEDKEIFFGRDNEIEELYRKSFESKIMLVYGVSGTGKSSLINCGLANKFNDADWLPINLRRAENINASLARVIEKNALSPTKIDVSKEKTVLKALQSLYLDHFKPIFLIFDQFEELFIFGSKSEQAQFIQLVKLIVDSDLQCRFLFVIREEYLASITEFEKVIPSFLNNRVRIEKMTHSNAMQAIEGPCKVNNILVEQGFSQALLEKLTPNSTEVELTYLQVFLDKIFKLSAKENYQFTHKLIEQCGNVSDLLGSFLEEQISQLAEPEVALVLLKAFVSVKGTKRQITQTEALEYAKTLGKLISPEKIKELIQHFVNLRILRDQDENTRYELRHDALAAKIFEKITLVEKELLEVRQFVEQAYNNYEKRQVLLNSQDIAYIAPWEQKMFLPERFQQFIAQSRHELLKIRKRKRNFAIVAALILLLIMGSFTWWAMRERDKAEINERKAKANYLSVVAKEIESTDPTKALILAEYAYNLDTTNKVIYGQLLKLYYNNTTYQTKISCISNTYNLFRGAIFSPDGCKILTSVDNQHNLILYNIEGQQIRKFNGHTDQINNFVFNSDGNFFLSSSQDGTVRLWNVNNADSSIILQHKKEIIKAIFSPTEKKILTCIGDSLCLWDYQGNKVNQYGIPDNIFIDIQFFPDGKTFLGLLSDGTIRTFDLFGNQKLILCDHKFYKALISHEGMRIYTSSLPNDETSSNDLCLWDISGKLIKRIKGHNGTIEDFDLSKNGTNLLTYSNDDRSIKILDYQENLKTTINLHNSELIFDASFTPDSKKIVVHTNKQIRIYNLEGILMQKFVASENDWLSVSRVSTNSKQLLNLSTDQCIYLWNIENNYATSLKKNIPKDFKIVSISDNQKFILATQFSNTYISRPTNFDIFLYNCSNSNVKQLKGHNAEITNVTFVNKDENILSSSQDGTAILWDLEGNRITTYNNPNNIGGLMEASLSNDAKYVTTCKENNVDLFEINGKFLRSFIGHNEYVISSKLSNDNRFLLSCSGDKTAILWDIDGNLLTTFIGHQAAIHDVEFVENTNLIITASEDKTIRLWNYFGELKQIFRGHTDGVRDVSYIPERNIVLSKSWDRTIKLWDMSGNQLQTIKNDSGALYMVAKYLPDRQQLLLIYDNQIYLKDIKIPYELSKYISHETTLSMDDKIRYNLVSFSEIIDNADINDLHQAAFFYIINYSNQENITKLNEFKNNARLLTKKIFDSNEKSDNLLYYYYFLLSDYDNNIIDHKKYLLQIFDYASQDASAAKFLNLNRYSTTYIIHSFNNENSKRNIEFILENLEKLSDKMLMNNKNQLFLNEKISNHFSMIAEHLIRKQLINSAKRFLILAQKFSVKNKDVNRLLPLIYLMSDEKDKAFKLYREIKTMTYHGKVNYQTIFLEDIFLLENIGIKRKNFTEAKLEIQKK